MCIQLHLIHMEPCVLLMQLQQILYILNMIMILAMKYSYIASKMLLKYKANFIVVFYYFPTQFLTFPPFPASNPIRQSSRISILFGTRQCTSNPRYTSIAGKQQRCNTSKLILKHQKFVILLLHLEYGYGHAWLSIGMIEIGVALSRP